VVNQLHQHTTFSCSYCWFWRTWAPGGGLQKFYEYLPGCWSNCELKFFVSPMPNFKNVKLACTGARLWRYFNLGTIITLWNFMYRLWHTPGFYPSTGRRERQQ